MLGSPSRALQLGSRQIEGIPEVQAVEPLEYLGFLLGGPDDQGNGGRPARIGEGRKAFRGEDPAVEDGEGEGPDAYPGRIQEGDELEVELESGQIKNLRTGELYQATPFPEFMQGIMAQGGLIEYVREKSRK